MAGKTNEEILEAVKSLDPANDEHWTSDGLPRLDAVENLLGAGVARKQVTNAAPDFNRGHAQSLVDDAHDEETAGPTEEDEDNADASESDETEADPSSPEDQDETDDASAADDEDDDTDPLAEGLGDKLDDLDEAVNKAQERVDMIRQGLEKGKIMLSEAEVDLQKAIEAKNTAFPPLSPAEAIKQFQRNELAKRAEARGVSVGAPSTLTEALRARCKVRHQGASLLEQK